MKTFVLVPTMLSVAAKSPPTPAVVVEVIPLPDIEIVIGKLVVAVPVIEPIIATVVVAGQTGAVMVITGVVVATGGVVVAVVVA